MAVTEHATARRAVFLDKDGTLVEDIPFNVDPCKIRLTPGAGAALAELHAAGFLLIVVTNQSGIAHGLFAEDALRPVASHIAELLAVEGAVLAGFYYCPHGAGGLCA